MADMAVMEAMADTDTARGPLMPRPTMVPDTDMAVMEVMVVVCTDTERGLLMPMPMAAMAVMEAMAATDTARGPLTLTTAMAVTAVATDTAMASIPLKVCNNILKPNCHPN